MLRAFDGARSIDPANQGVDITPLDRTAATVNATSVEMSNFASLIGMMMAGVIDAATNVVLWVQESNEAAANFVNITGASKALEAGDDDQSVQVYVDWRHPDRLKYARLVGIVTGSGSALYGAWSLRVDSLRNDGSIGADAAAVNAA
jgi:hypothetical protein